MTTFEDGKDEMANVKEEERGSQQNDGEAVYEVRGASATTVNTEEQYDGKVNASQDEDTEECSHEDKNSMDFEAIIRVEEKDRECKIERRKLKATTMDNPGKTTPKMTLMEVLTTIVVPQPGPQPAVQPLSHSGRSWHL